MATQLPRVLQNLNLFVDGRGYAGRVDQITLPKLTLQTADYRAGGMDVPIELDLGMQKLEAQMIVSDFDPELFGLFGWPVGEGVPMTLRGAFQAQGSPAVMPVTVNLIGRFKIIDPGNWKPGEKSAITLSVSVSYYRLTIDGQDMVEIDAVNMVRIVDGVDHLALQRAAIGI